MPGPVVRKAIDQALVTRDGPDVKERADEETDLDRMVEATEETELYQALREAARRNPRAALLETADLMEARTSEAGPGALSWPVGVRDHEDGGKSATTRHSGQTERNVPTTVPPTPIWRPAFRPRKGSGGPRLRIRSSSTTKL